METHAVKNVWIINHYAGETFFDKGGRHYWLAKHLSRRGFSPVIFCCNNKHNPGTQEWLDISGLWEEHVAEEIGVPYVFVKGRKYEGNGKQRLFNMYSFYHNVKKAAIQYSVEHEKPDIIIASSVHLLSLVAGIQIAKQIGIKCICEYRDLWPDELISMNVMGENSLPAIVLRSIEYWTYKKADALVFTMEGATEYIRHRKWNIENGGAVDLSKAFYLNNGVDLEDYKSNLSKYILDDKDLNNKETFKVVYTGVIRKANGIDKILSIAKELRDCPQIVFLLFGGGDEVEEIKKQIEVEHIDNVIYKGMINKQYVPYVLSKSNLNILNYMNGDLFKYGCSNNKLFEYLASGKMILCTIRMNYSILKKYDCGIEIDENTSISEIGSVIRKIYTSPQIAEKYNKNAEIAIKDFDFSNLIEILEKAINKAQGANKEEIE